MLQFVLLIFYNYLIHFTLSEWSFSGIGGSSGQFIFNVNIQQSTTYIDIVYHGTGKWVGMGFGGKTMTNVYAMIFAAESPQPTANVVAMDYWLTGHGSGTQQSTCSGTCVNLISYVTQSSNTIINASVPNNVGGLYTFDNSGSTAVDMIIVDGVNNFAYNGGHCNGCWSAHTFTYSTQSAAAVKKISKTKLGLSPISLELIVYQSNSTMDITIYGPNDRWFGIAWGTHSHADALIYDGSVKDYYLGGQDDTLVLADTNQNYVVLSDSVINSERVLHVTRTFDTGDPTQDLVFDMTFDINSFMVAQGASSGVYLVSYHGNTNRWSVAVGYDGVSVPSTTTTTTTSTTPSPTSYAAVKKMSKTLLGESPISLALIVYQSNSTMDLTMYGPNDRWFGIAWGDHSRADALIYDGSVVKDYYLGGQVSNLVVEDTNQDYVVLSNSVVNNERVIHVTRLFDTGDSAQDLVFDMTFDINSFMVAQGSGTNIYDIDYHGLANRWNIIVGYDGVSLPSDTTTTTTSVTTDDEPTQPQNEDVNEKEFLLSEIGTGSGIFVAIKMTKSTEIYDLELHGPMDRWFGVTWETHFGGAAFIYVGDGINPDYIVSGQVESEVLQDAAQSWTVENEMELDGKRQIIARRLFDSTDDFTRNKVTLLVAHGVDSDSLNNLAYHGIHKWKVTIDLESGAVSEFVTNKGFYLLNHVIFMFVGFGFLIPFGVLLFRFRLIFFQRFQSFWIIPMVRSCFILGTISVWVGLIEKIGHNHQENMNLITLNTVHSYIGLLLISIWSLCMIISLIIYNVHSHKKQNKNEFKFLDNPISCMIIVLFCVMQILLGAYYSYDKNKSIKLIGVMLLGAYCLIYLVIYIVFEIYQSNRKTKLLDGKNQKFELELIHQNVNGTDTKNKSTLDAIQSHVIVYNRQEFIVEEGDDELAEINPDA